jgi:hypothetical protein
MLEVKTNTNLISDLVTESKKKEFYYKMADYIIELRKKSQNRLVNKKFYMFINLKSESTMVVNDYYTLNNWSNHNGLEGVEYFSNTISIMNISFARYKDKFTLFSGDKEEVANFLKKSLHPKIKKECNDYQKAILNNTKHKIVSEFTDPKQFVIEFIDDYVGYPNPNKYQFLTDEDIENIGKYLPELAKEKTLHISDKKIYIILSLFEGEQFIKMALFLKENNFFK